MKIFDKLFKNLNSEKEQISSNETFHIWNTLRVRYISTETYNLYKNFIHDKDLGMIINDHLEQFNQEIEQLENLTNNYQVKAPDRPAEDINTTKQLDQITDRYIFRKMYADLISELHYLIRPVTESISNDNVREFFSNMLFDHIDMLGEFYKYGKAKGWVEVVPPFRIGQATEKEPIAVSEADHLWTHINDRYTQLEMTANFGEYVHDKEFKQILNLGNEELKNQIELLENKALEFEIPLPTKPPATTNIPADPEIIEDKYLYSLIIKGIRDSVKLHIGAITESLRNDSIRDMFKQLLKKEVTLYTNLIKYGKLKGWTTMQPKHYS